ncbi:MAG: DUF1775 domain-containing protein [Caulobacteraceae bacterium]
MKYFVLAAALAAIASSAAAHVSLSPASVPAGSYFFGEFRIAHGCAGRDTISIKVEIPDAILVAKPQPKTGWSLETESKPLDKPNQVDGPPGGQPRQHHHLAGRSGGYELGSVRSDAQAAFDTGRAGLPGDPDVRTGRGKMGRGPHRRQPASGPPLPRR